jgi:hypothetical protein
MLPARALLHSAPVWLRMFVLAGVGVLLWLPLMRMSFRNLSASPDSQAKEVAERFLNAQLQGNSAELIALAVPAMQKVMTGPIAVLFSGCSISSDDIGSPTIQGANASVEFTLTHPKRARIRGRLNLIWEEQSRTWMVRDMVYPLIEQPNGALGALAGRQHDDAQLLEYHDLTTLDAPSLEKAWRADLDARDELAGPLLRRLLSDAGYLRNRSPIGRGSYVPQRDAPFNGWEKKRVTLAMHQRSRLEIIDTVAKTAGMELRQFEGVMLSDTVAFAQNTVAFAQNIGSEGPFFIAARDPDFPPPVAFAGPFRVEAKSFTESGRYATGHLQMAALAVKLPISVLYVLDGWRPELPDPVVRSADGRDLFHRDRRDRIGPPVFRVNREAKSCTMEWGVPLRNLTADVTQIRSMRGSLSVLLPVKLDIGKILLDGREEGSARIGPAELKWKRHAGSPPVATFPPMGGSQVPANAPTSGFKVSLDTSVPCRICWLATDRRGAGLQTGTLNGSGERYVPLPAESAALEFKVFTTEEIRYPFELAGIRNPNRPPSRLAPLTFSGQSVPLSFPSQTIRGRSVMLEIRNHTNKPVEEVRLELRCLNRAGTELGKQAVVHPALSAGVRMSTDPKLSPFLGRKAMVSIYASVIPPEATERIEVTLVRVLFSDGTTWSPPVR